VRRAMHGVYRICLVVVAPIVLALGGDDNDAASAASDNSKQQRLTAMKGVVSSTERASLFADYTVRSRKWRASGQETADGFVSGAGSSLSGNKMFITWLNSWLVQHQSDVKSIVECSAGHWPTGWQRHVNWTPLNYTGVDLLPAMVADNELLFSKNPLKFGLGTARFITGDMVNDHLPVADLLLTKDTLIHTPINAITAFLHKNVLECPPRFCYVMLVHNQYSDGSEENNKDVRAVGDVTGKRDIRAQTQGLNFSAAPFSLPTTLAYTYLAHKGGPKAVEILAPGRLCPRRKNPCRYSRWTTSAN